MTLDQPGRTSRAEGVYTRLRRTSALLAELADRDAAYQREHFVTLAELCDGRRESRDGLRELIRSGAIPQPAYIREDGSELVRPDYLALVDAAGGVEHLRAHFYARYRQAAAALADEVALQQADAEWEAYLRGTYGVCLRSVTPENIVRKDHLMRTIEALLERPAPDERDWIAQLRDAVEELDSLELPFAPLDEFRLGARPSRWRLINDVRARYPIVFARRDAPAKAATEPV